MTSVPARSRRPGFAQTVPITGIYNEAKPEPPVFITGEEAKKFEGIYQPPKPRNQEKHHYVPGSNC